MSSIVSYEAASRLLILMPALSPVWENTCSCYLHCRRAAA